MPNATESAPQNAPAGAQPGAFVDPYRAYNFKLDFGGVTIGHFTECSGMDIKVHPIRYREGGTNEVTHATPGPVEYGDITLRYGLTSSRDMWDWFMTAVKGKVERKNVSIILLDSDGATEIMRWNLNFAWPSHWQGSLLNALSREVAVESLTLVFETFERG